MSRSLEEWTEQRDTATQIRSLIWQCTDKLDYLDEVRFPEITDPFDSLERALGDAINECNRIIGACTRTFDSEP